MVKMWLLQGVLLVIAVALAASGEPPKKQMFFDWVEVDQEFEEIVENSRRALVDPIDEISYRLPNQTYPIHYLISLKTGVRDEDFTFNGTVEIDIGVRETTNQVTVHYRQINITKVDILDQSGAEIELEAKFELEEPRDFLVIEPTQGFTEGVEYKIRIEYDGTLRTDNNGFYRSSYVNANGTTIWLATSKFESTNARHGFPCYDEPGIRAEYTVQMEHHKNYMTLSNMPEDSKTPVPGTENVITKFERSRPFQTYLVAFIVSDFEALENLDVTPPQRVFTTPGKKSQVAFALEHGVSVMKKFEDILGVEYLLPKMDQMSIPDFASGAMENFGLVTYREVYMLYDEKIHTTNSKLNVAEVISHEFAHQWFGNLVSPAWWQYIWLNEGFATLFESYATHLVYPEWREMDTFVTGTVHSVMQSDSQLGVRAMSYYTENPVRIAALFDNVIYSKSGSVLRMLQHVLTEETFSKGLNLYLKDRYTMTATPSDLYRNLQAALDQDYPDSKIDVAEFMDTWEMQGGFPVVHVSRNESVLTISQSKYLQNYINEPEVENKSIWHIPISYTVGSTADTTKTTPNFWLKTENITIDNATTSMPWIENDWFLFNIQETGYYRVNYDIQIWIPLSVELNFGNLAKIPIVNRAQLIDDSFNLARSKRLFYVVPFDIIAYLRREDDYIPWAAFNRAMTFLHTYLVGSPYYEHFRKLMRGNADMIYSRLGVEPIQGEPFLDIFGRNLAINWACMMGHEYCLGNTTALMALVSQNQKVIVPDLETVIYCNGLRGASPDLIQTMWNLALTTRSADKTLIMNSIGCSYDPSVILWYLDTALDMTNSYTLADRARVFSAIYTNGGYAGYELVLDYVWHNYDAISLTISNGTLINIFSNLASRVSNAGQFDKLSEVSDFLVLAGHPNGSIISSVNNAATRLDFVQLNLPTIEGWLEVNVMDVPNPTELPITTSLPVVTSEGQTNPSEANTEPTQSDITTIGIQTTTNGGGIIIASILVILTAALFKSMM